MSASSIKDKDELLDGVSKATNELIVNHDLNSALEKSLRILSEAAKVDVITIFDNSIAAGNNEELLNSRFEWIKSTGVFLENIQNIQNAPYSEYPELHEALSKGNIFSALTKDLHGVFRERLEARKILSIITIPIYFGSKFWGGITFADTQSERIWSKNERSTLYATTATIGGAIERKKFETAVKESEERYKQLIEDASDIIYRADFKGFFTYVNPITARAMNMRAEDIIGHHFTELIRPDYREKAGNFYKDQFIKKIPVTYFEFPVINSEIANQWIGQNVKLLHENGWVTGFQAVARDITDKKNAEDAVKLSETKYRSIIENMELGLVEVDAFDNIINAYDRFCAITGYSQEELNGKNLLTIFTGKKFKSKLSLQNTRKFLGLKSVFEIQIQKKNGEVIWVLISETPLYDANKNIRGSIGIYQDITERKNSEGELIRAKEFAEHSKQAKEQFLANMSHEIRTPMNAIVGMTDILLEGQLSPDTKECLDTIKLSADNLLYIINDILDFSKIESGKITFEKAPFRLRDVLDGIVKILDISAKNKNISLTYSVDNDIPDNVIGDTVRLRQILLNLASNSIKFTEKGTVNIDARLRMRQNDDHIIEFSVTDSGIGIPEDKLSSIFESFTQASGDTTRKYGGTGLGLTIAKQLIELQGGNVIVKSKINEGSTFSFALSFKKDLTEKDQKSPEKISYTFTELSGTKVLLVEDNVVNQFLAKKILDKWQLHSDIADNGKVAIEKFKQNNYDIILMDVQMPEMDGYEATAYIRNKMPDPKSNIPIIALTAFALKGEAEKCVEMGMDDYISKPFNQTNLYEKMLKLIKKDSKHK
jgi:PAS domain S-box-containing protein